MDCRVDFMTIATGNFNCTDDGKSKTSTRLIITIPRSRVDGSSDDCLTDNVNWELAFIVPTKSCTPSGNVIFTGSSEACTLTSVTVIFTKTGAGGEYGMLMLLVGTGVVVT